MHIGADDSHDLGYALRSEFWRRGIASEACAAAIAQARAAGIPYLTATHDIDNPRSGAAMRRSLSRLAAIDADLTVYPGHGPASTLAEEKRTNPYLRNAL